MDTAAKTLSQQLTPRQFEIAALIRDGHSNAVIAELLGITENTVKKYLTAAFLRTRCDGRVTLAIRYEREHPKPT